MRKLLLLNFLLPFICYAFGSDKKVYYMGGGGESEIKQSTMFDYSFKNFQNLEGRGWEAKYLFDDTHFESRKLLTETKEKGAPFTKKNALSMLENIENNLKDPNSKASQVLIIFDTHGDIDKSKYKIATSDGVIEVIDQLKRIKKIAAKKGVKIGIIGATCFSGNLIELGDENTCVISASPPETVGFNDTSNLFAELISSKKIKNLEDLHLLSRANRNFFLSQPMISTPEGMQAYEQLKSLRIPLSAYFPNYLIKKKSCDRDYFTETIQKLTELATRINQDIYKDFFSKEIIKLEQIAQNIANYKNIYGPSIDQIFKKDCLNLKSKGVKATACFTSPSDFLEYKALVTNELEKYKEYYSNPNNDAKDKSMYALRISQLSLNLDFIKKVESSNKFKKKKELEDALPKDLKNSLTNFSHQVGVIEADLYNSLYYYYRTKSTKKNICSQFQL